MKIQDKSAGLKLLKAYDLNVVPSQVVFVDELSTAKDFMEKYPANEYCMRNLNSVLGGVHFVKSFVEFKKYVGEYETSLLLSVSMRDYNENKVLLGDLRINKATNTIELTAKDDENADHRNLYDNPKYVINGKTLDEVLDMDDIDGLADVLLYAIKHALYDMYIEFVVFDRPVGTKGEKVLIYELRTDY